jgi:hypothetical protein
VCVVTDPQLISEGSQKLASVPSGGGGGGSAPAAAAGGAAPAEEKAEEKKEEAKEESDDDMVCLHDVVIGRETDKTGLRSIRLIASRWNVDLMGDSWPVGIRCIICPSTLVRWCLGALHDLARLCDSMTW